jgi:hypothetical protein
MTASPASSSQASIPPRKPGVHRPAAVPEPVLADGRRVHDEQRELVRASLIARAPGEESAHGEDSAHRPPA